MAIRSLSLLAACILAAGGASLVTSGCVASGTTPAIPGQATGGTAADSPSPTPTPADLSTAYPGSGSAPGDLTVRLTPEVARTAMAAFANAFYIGTPYRGYYADNSLDRLRDPVALTSPPRLADFWKESEMIETAEDYWEITRDVADRQLVAALCRGFLLRYGSDWLSIYSITTGAPVGPRANDDVMWIVIALCRAGTITGNRTYPLLARQNFDRVYRRAWSTHFGGGLWWRSATDRPRKNTTTNATAVMAAANIYLVTGDRRYLAIATHLYEWTRSRLYVPKSGAVWDYVGSTKSGKTRVRVTKMTYNQGTFIGAARILYRLTQEHRYLADALRALQYTRAHLQDGGVLQNDARKDDQDAGGFKGIFARQAIGLTRDLGITAYDPWFRFNAYRAWSHRNSRDLVYWNWLRPTPNRTLYSFDCSGIVAMMEIALR